MPYRKCDFCNNVFKISEMVLNLHLKEPKKILIHCTFCNETSSHTIDRQTFENERQSNKGFYE